MSPTEIQDLIDFEAFTPLRLTLASGDVLVLTDREGLSVTGLMLSVTDVSITGRRRLRLVSIPNIVLIEPVPERGEEVADVEGRTR